MDPPLYILMLSLHGLVRGQPQLGLDADTGGQVQYVVDLARALGRDARVERVDLITRLIDDPNVDASYATAHEELSERAAIVRLPFGPRRYVRKESIWSHLDQLVDRCLWYLRSQQRLPDVIHSHYADAGYVGRQLSVLLGVPLIHTSHSLGRQKQARLLDAGRKAAAIERQFRFERRIRAEEDTLDQASLVVASTRQEVETQYVGYERFDPRRARVIPPGIDLARFSPGAPNSGAGGVGTLFEPFLRDARRPAVLALCRPDKHKNVDRLLRAFATTPGLRERANLLIVAGNREDIRAADEAAERFYTDLLLDIDRHDLYGSVAVPKQHRPDHVPDIYRYVAQRRGVLANPALTENFGLTLIEAAASALPVVATAQGGPREIIANCRHGVLVDPLDEQGIGMALLHAITDRQRWRRWSRNGVAGAARHYTWQAHADTYLSAVEQLRRRNVRRIPRLQPARRSDFGSPLTLAEAVLVTDLDNTLIGDDASMNRVLSWIADHAGKVAFGVATGRTRTSAISLLKRHRVPLPDVLITSVGTDICYGPSRIEDDAWHAHIDHQWRRDELIDALGSLPGVRAQQQSSWTRFKLAYYVDPRTAPSIHDINTTLRERGLRAQLVFSHDSFLDVVPVRASKGRAVRHLAYRWSIPLSDFLIAGDSGNDHDMLTGEPLGVVVGGHSDELSALRGTHHMFFATSRYAEGILEGIEHYGFGTRRRDVSEHPSDSSRDEIAS
jgi:sucrose-phosphate synthase